MIEILFIGLTLFGVWFLITQTKVNDKAVTIIICFIAVLGGLKFAPPVGPKISGPATQEETSSIVSELEVDKKQQESLLDNTLSKNYGEFKIDTKDKFYLNGESGYPPVDIVVKYHGIAPPFIKTFTIGPADGSVGDLDSETVELIDKGVLVKRIEDYNNDQYRQRADTEYRQEFYKISYGLSTDFGVWVFWIALLFLFVYFYIKRNKDKASD